MTHVLCSLLSIERCSESDTYVGWEVSDRAHDGTPNNQQIFITTREFKCHGVVTQWRYWPARSVPFKAMVLRKVHGSDETKYNIVGINAIPDGAIDQSLIYQVPDNERISVQIGDVIGFAWNSPAVKHSQNLDNTGDTEDIYMIKNITDPMTNLRVNDTMDPYETRTRAYSIQAVISGRFEKD